MTIKDLNDFTKKHMAITPIENLNNTAIAVLTINNSAYKAQQVCAVFDNNTNDFVKSCDIASCEFVAMHKSTWYS